MFAFMHFTLNNLKFYLTECHCLSFCKCFLARFKDLILKRHKCSFNCVTADINILSKWQCFDFNVHENNMIQRHVWRGFPSSPCTYNHLYINHALRATLFFTGALAVMRVPLTFALDWVAICECDEFSFFCHDSHMNHIRTGANGKSCLQCDPASFFIPLSFPRGLHFLRLSSFCSISYMKGKHPRITLLFSMWKITL